MAVQMKGKDEMFDPRVIPGHIEGVLEFINTPIYDSRGHSVELMPSGFPPGYEFETASLARTFRGFHFQAQPHSQDKLVRCLQGCATSFIVDLRVSSPTFLDVESIRLKPFRQVFVPRGCAHGMYTHEVGARILYKMTDRYAPESYHRLRFDDPQLSIHWERIGDIDHISTDDFNGETLAEIALKGLLFP